ncbi:MAG: UvrD-helicase domain-containing protein [Chitinispirillia bacterium]|nr:UvrD-helicase domain-containing protein [Chitinispirillia bacterium]MCL2267933.1 UvrD-helicase domain-containing protein [Chitinispirillia bacterium]
MDNSKSILDTLALNSVQREAVAYIDGPELVFAGAGTGKTRVLTAKIAYLIDRGYYPSRIFAATFTNKAAAEMRERVERFIGAPAAGLWIGTFHSLCCRILRADAAAIGYPQAFTIFDTGKQLSLVKKLMQQLDIDEKTIAPKTMLAIISSKKAACVTPDEYEKAAFNYRDREEIAPLYRGYQKALKEQQAMDFDDLISNTVYMLRKNPDILKKYQDKFNYVLVDEYQDTNRAQFLLVQLLSMGHGKIFAVGDDDQSIYGWRGAMIENILSFEKEFPNAKKFKLEENYRSTTAILKFANAAIKPNKVRAVKELWTGRAAGTPVKINRFRDDRQEADYVAGQCEELTKRMSGAGIAVLFRTNSQSRVFEESFRKRKIPYILVGGTSFYERAEIMDCMAYLSLLVNPKDDGSFERIMNVPPRGLGDKAKEALVSVSRQLNRSGEDWDEYVSLLDTVMKGHAEKLPIRSVKGFSDLRETFERLNQLAAENAPPAGILEEMLRQSGYMDMLMQKAAASEEEAGRVENVNELMNALTAWREENPDGGLAGFLEGITLAGDIDSWDPEANAGAVNFMTLHCAKGLEFKTVFLVGVEDGIIPSRQNFDDEGKIEEERRLFYVGSTRAMDALECCYADQRFRFGSIQPSDPSRFIDDVPTDLYTFSNNSAFFGGGAAKFGGGSTKFGGSPAASQSRTPPPARPAKTFLPIKADTPPAPIYDEYSQLAEPQYRIGQVVTHKTFGRGKITSLSGFGADMKITVLFTDGQRRNLMAKFAKLE